VAVCGRSWCCRWQTIGIAASAASILQLDSRSGSTPVKRWRGAGRLRNDVASVCACRFPSVVSVHKSSSQIEWLMDKEVDRHSMCLRRCEHFRPPPQVWFLLGSTAISICGISLRDSVVSKSKRVDGSALEGVDIEWFTRLFSGIENPLRNLLRR